MNVNRLLTEVDKSSCIRSNSKTENGMPGKDSLMLLRLLIINREDQLQPIELKCMKEEVPHITLVQPRITQLRK
jgi:hypothetical protein